MILPEEQIQQTAKIVVTDKEFSELLHQITDRTKEYVEKEPRKGVIADITVFTKHKVKEQFSAIPMILVDFPPSPNALIDRYDVLQLVGAKYFTEMVQKKNVGEKCYPIAVFLTSEAWMRGMTHEEHEKTKGKSLGEFEDSKEVIIIAGMSMDGRENSSMMKVTRNKEDHIFLSPPRFLEFEEESKNFQSGSDLTKAFYVGFIKAMQKSNKK